MDLLIKLEPNNFENSDTLSCEFLEEFSNDQKIGNISETYIINNNVEQIEHNGTDVQNQLGKGAVDNKPNELGFHTRKVLLRAFKEEGCSVETLKKYCITNNFNVDVATEYFNKIARNAQDNVYQECDSLSFNNITEWLKYFKASGRSQHCNYEAAIVLNAIANNEFHPVPELMGGIDLKAIYKFLSNALMGLPQAQLDETSAEFLSNEFQSLIDEANTDEADNDVQNMKLKIEESLLHTIPGKSYGLDPLNTNTEELKQYYVNIKKENI